MAGIAAVMAEPGDGGARVLGAHLEGPFVSPRALGAQPPFAIPPDLPLLEELAATAPIRVATYAPEIDPEGALLACFRRLGNRAQIGHTTCSYAQARMALANGAAGFTHLYNAMSGLHHRQPGAVGAALAHAESAELILDLQHVDEGAALAALRAIPKLHCITDAVAAAGMPDGDYRLGTHTVTKRGETVPSRTSSPWACRSPRPPAAAARSRPTIWASPTAAGWCPVRPPTSSSWTLAAGSRRCWSRAGRSRKWPGTSAQANLAASS
jgi:N-acetylglucosamine-6-phosphate deacetylase